MAESKKVESSSGPKRDRTAAKPKEGWSVFNADGKRIAEGISRQEAAKVYDRVNREEGRRPLDIQRD